MNMLLHGVENPDIRYRDSLAESDEDDAEKYSLILANPPFAGSLDYESTAKDLQQVVKTKKDRDALPGSFPAPAADGRPCRSHRPRRRALWIQQGAQDPAEDPCRGSEARRHRLDALGRLQTLCRGIHPPSCSSPRRTRAARTTSGSTTCRRTAFPLDDKRTPQPDKSDLADILARWQKRDAEGDRARTDQSFLVPVSRDRGQRLRPLHQPLQGSRI